jgi:hypothetical protein
MPGVGHWRKRTGTRPRSFLSTPGTGDRRGAQGLFCVARIGSRICSHITGPRRADKEDAGAVHLAGTILMVLGVVFIVAAGVRSPSAAGRDRFSGGSSARCARAFDPAPRPPLLQKPCGRDTGRLLRQPVLRLAWGPRKTAAGNDRRRGYPASAPREFYRRRTSWGGACRHSPQLEAAPSRTRAVAYPPNLQTILQRQPGRPARIDSLITTPPGDPTGPQRHALMELRYCGAIERSADQ